MSSAQTISSLPHAFEEFGPALIGGAVVFLVVLAITFVAWFAPDKTVFGGLLRGRKCPRKCHRGITEVLRRFLRRV